MNVWRTREGSQSPLGATWIPADQAYNFAIFSQTATEVSVLLYSARDLQQPVFRLNLDPLINKSDDIWHCRISATQAAEASYYSLQTSSCPSVTGAGRLFAEGKELLDPYAREIFFPPAFQLGSGLGQGSNAGRAALGILPPKAPEVFDWGSAPWPLRGGDLLIYELHVRGFTQNANSGVRSDHAGTYLGVIDKIPYLQELGVTAIELLPVFCFEPHGVNYWGYMPMSFFYPHPTYATDPLKARNEFRQMVKALHDAGIEVILDVVFNHTAEGGSDGPNFSLKGLDNPSYYLVAGAPPSEYRDLSGTGNTLDASSPVMRGLLLDSLRFWVSEMHVDGFRFDLASVLARNKDGSLDLNDPPIFAEIAADPELADIRMIAEPWDASDGYLLGRSFPGLNWMQWNGQYRDLVKRFVRGEEALVGQVATRLYGSDDLFPGDVANSRHPYQSINYVVSHDGFTLYDTVSYDNRHNEANGANNTDGPSDNISWNCGYEGDDGAPTDVLQLRRRQVKNFFTLQMMSNGTPMIRMGDEFLQTQHGNSNPWNQDNATSWLDWSRLNENLGTFRFVKMLIAFRNAHPAICRSRFWREDVTWYGPNGGPDFSQTSHTLAYMLRGGSQKDKDIYVLVNMYWQPVTFEVQAGSNWLRVVDTSQDSPDDILSPESMVPLSMTVAVQPQSVVIAISS
jgi:isoamylase